MKNTHTQSTKAAGNYKQISQPERQFIERWVKEKVPVREIAARLGRHRSSVYRELQRGRVIHKDSELREFVTYSSDRGQDERVERATAHGAPLKIGCEHGLVNRFRKLITENKMSLYAAHSCLTAQGVDTKVCVRTLYNYVHRFHFPISPQDLVQGPPKPRRKSTKTLRLAHSNLFGQSIEKRPAFINARSELGHHEMDTVVGPPGSKGVLLVLTERVSRFEHILMMKDKSQHSVKLALNRLERFYGPSFSNLFKSITCDNGCEFLDAAGIAKSCLRKSNRTTVYYAHPYCASERGSNENANRLIRRFIPKGTDFSHLKQSDLNHLAMWMNFYPRKIFNGRSSWQITDQYSFHFTKSHA